ncbi:MAG TPA: hypothetical protein VLI04_05895 [Nocardioidaceae bacterium]|nr:hypothetical protein [Nocardioidaceae bacterium]
MSERVVLHVGAMKSGTSFIQQTLAENKDVLAGQGFLFPGEVWRHQVLGVIDVLGQLRDGKPMVLAEGMWQRLLDEMSAHDGTSLISMEFLAPVPKVNIRKVLDSLAPAQVDVVLTVRDLGRNIPAMWQEGVQNAETWTWDDFEEAIRTGDPTTPGWARRFWRPMAIAAIADRWVSEAGVDHVTIVTGPPPGAPRDLLWRRFCDAVRLDPEPFVMPERDNASIGAASALVLRDLNVHLKELTTNQYNAVIKHELAKRGMAARRREEQTIGFTADDWVRERAQGMIERFQELGVRIVGDLEDLRPIDTEGVDLRAVPVADREEAAVAALAHLVQVWSASQTEGSTDE